MWVAEKAKKRCQLKVKSARKNLKINFFCPETCKNCSAFTREPIQSEIPSKTSFSPSVMPSEVPSRSTFPLTVIPSESPSRLKLQIFGLVCIDDETFYWKTKRKNCKNWVALKPHKRCSMKIRSESVTKKVHDYCKATCRKCKD